MRIASVLALGALVVAAGLTGTDPARAQQGKLVRCKLSFDLQGWSVFYKQSTGKGVVTCDNGQSAPVKIVARGGGLSFGTHSVIEGKGTFTGVTSIENVFGNYFDAGAHGAVGPGGEGRTLQKSGVGLSLSGSGNGVGAGFAFGGFRISRG